MLVALEDAAFHVSRVENGVLLRNDQMHLAVLGLPPARLLLDHFVEISDFGFTKTRILLDGRDRQVTVTVFAAPEYGDTSIPDVGTHRLTLALNGAPPEIVTVQNPLDGSEPVSPFEFWGNLIQFPSGNVYRRRAGDKAIGRLVSCHFDLGTRKVPLAFPAAGITVDPKRVYADAGQREISAPLEGLA